MVHRESIRRDTGQKLRDMEECTLSALRRLEDVRAEVRSRIGGVIGEELSKYLDDIQKYIGLIEGGRQGIQDNERKLVSMEREERKKLYFEASQKVNEYIAFISSEFLGMRRSFHHNEVVMASTPGQLWAIMADPKYADYVRFEAMRKLFLMQIYMRLKEEMEDDKWIDIRYFLKFWRQEFEGDYSEDFKIGYTDSSKSCILWVNKNNLRADRCFLIEKENLGNVDAILKKIEEEIG